MDEAVIQSGELLLGVLSALAIIGIFVLLISHTNAGVLRIYLAYILEAAC